jgi:hypothetical protein
MKRFGWPRPALLIGYVLSSRVETSIYHTMATSGLSIFTQPIVIVLIGLTILSIVAAIKYKTHAPAMSDDGVHARRNLAPQMIFFCAVVGLALLVIRDGLRREFLTAVYPLFAGSICLVFMIPMGIEMLRTKNAATVFYDSNKETLDGSMVQRSNEYYLLWLLGMLGISAITGFVLGIAIFIYTFIRLRGEMRHLACAISAGVFVLLLGTLSYFMHLNYPEGILQSYVTLPWPLQ